MSRKQARTPRSKVRSALRQLWLRSRERSAAIKRENGSCEGCGKKQSRAKGREVKIEVHHNAGAIPWEHLIDEVYRHLLCEPKHLTVFCAECHAKEHE